MFYDPGCLIPVTNTRFVTLIYLVVACVAMRSFAATGQIHILLLGCRALVFGVAAAFAGFAKGHTEASACQGACSKEATTNDEPCWT